MYRAKLLNCTITGTSDHEHAKATQGGWMSRFKVMSSECTWVHCFTLSVTFVPMLHVDSILVQFNSSSYTLFLLSLLLMYMYSWDQHLSKEQWTVAGFHPGNCVWGGRGVGMSPAMFFFLHDQEHLHVVWVAYVFSELYVLYANTVHVYHPSLSLSFFPLPLLSFFIRGKSNLCSSLQCLLYVLSPTPVSHVHVWFSIIKNMRSGWVFNCDRVASQCYQAMLLLGRTIAPPLLHTPLNACNTNRVHIHAASIIPPWTRTRYIVGSYRVGFVQDIFLLVQNTESLPFVSPINTYDWIRLSAHAHFF